MEWYRPRYPIEECLAKQFCEHKYNHYGNDDISSGMFSIALRERNTCQMP